MTHTAFACEESHSNQVQLSSSLVCAAQSGSAVAFSELHSLYERRIYRTILSITQNKEDAEDAMQDAFLRAYLAIKGFEGRANFYSWLTRIAINSALMVLRKRRVRAAFILDLPYDSQEEEIPFDFKDTSPTPEQSYRNKQEHLRLTKAIERLGPRLRVVVEEHLRQDGSLREVARTLDLSEAAVKSRLYRARRRLALTSTRMPRFV
ncbi:RNA polymerase sigma factor [Acidicapsa ligni]|uniref:RNA polymerase sigma factor n=1 Tax=Acidicapsa ligni TaxID=542300 RepID=UPI0021E0B00F|nr:sigma-70 family RNA polymerase sigma factor [Acidicapsa ligni]